MDGTADVQATSSDQATKSVETAVVTSDTPEGVTPVGGDLTQEPGEELIEEKTESDKPNAEKQKKKTPYVNPERHKTGGPQREKLSADELAEKMEKIKIRNEEIKQRRLAVQADEEAFNATQEQERAKQAANRKIQDSVNRSRDENARRKMEKITHREWDSGKNNRERNTRNVGGRKPDSEGVVKAESGKARNPSNTATKQEPDAGKSTGASPPSVKTAPAETR